MRSSGGALLQKEKTDIGTQLEEPRKSLGGTRCMVYFDGWTDQKGKALLNFIVNYEKGTNFMMHLYMLKMQHCSIFSWMNLSKHCAACGAGNH